MRNEIEADDDQAARHRILQDLDDTFLIEAGAGSGKTTSVVGRIIALLKSGRAQVKEIAAITFTNKAASELAGRFRMKLEQELRQTGDQEERERLERALAHIHESFIGTIHAFCGKLLRERPIEAKLDPAFQEMEEAQDKEFRNHCWEVYLDLLRQEGKDAVIDELAALRVNVEDLRAVYYRVSQFEDIEVNMQTVEKPDFNLIRLSLFRLMDAAVPYIPSAKPDNDWDDLQKLLRQSQKLLQLLDMDDDMNVLTVAKLYDRTLRVTMNRWTDREAAKFAKERLHEWQISVLWPFLTSWREYLHPKLVAFVQPAVKYCSAQRASEGRLNFQDLLMQASALLREHREVRAYFAQRYTRLFVDEFQDTDPIQAEMLLLLTGSNPQEDNWRLQLPRPGSLFIVGDPKQSIYRFRRADISTYNFVKERIAASGFVLRLTKNFRSVHAIGSYVNYAFESKFTKDGQPSDSQAAFVTMATQQPNPAGRKASHGIFTLTIPKVDYDRKSVISDEDSERIARYIAWACKGNLMIQDKDGNGNPLTRPAAAGDFMILLKRKQYINLYAAKLEQYGIASDTSGSQVVYEELVALSHLAQALNDTTDSIPLLAVLRGMLFGISDEALYSFSQEVGRLSIHAESQAEMESISADSQHVLSALHKLFVYAAWVSDRPALAALTSIVHDTGLIPLSAVSHTGALRSGTLVKLLEAILTTPAAAANWSMLTAYLQSITETQGLEGTSLFAGSGNAVRIMNVHKAKGLEAPVVFMASPCGDRSHDAEEHIDRLAQPPQGYFTISRPKDAYNTEIIAEPIGWERLSERERTYMLAEADRLLYVAATRAKQLLIVSRYPSRPAIDPWSQLGDSLDGQPELDDRAITPVAVAPLLQSPNVHGAVADWEQYAIQASAPTYEVTSVTALSKFGGGMQLSRPEGGGGAAFGSTVHRCLQALGEGLTKEELPDYCELVASQEGLKLEWLGRAMDAVQSVTVSELWQRSLLAKQRFFEYSFMIKRQSAAGADVLVRGVIDLLFEERDGWVIVDFKTDQFALQNEEQFVSFYRPQVLAYAAEWTETFGYPVKQSGLYFIYHDKFVAL